MKRVIILSIILSLLVVGFGNVTLKNTFRVLPAYAEDDEDENERENESDSRTSSTSTKEVQYKEVIEYRPVTKTVTVTEPAFAKDTDGDGLVDGLDPDPAVDQHQYFMDDDHDSMPNVYDRYPEADDFSYLDDQTDTDHNGLIDAYESQ